MRSDRRNPNRLLRNGRWSNEGALFDALPQSHDCIFVHELNERLTWDDPLDSLTRASGGLACGAEEMLCNGRATLSNLNLFRFGYHEARAFFSDGSVLRVSKSFINNPTFFNREVGR